MIKDKYTIQDFIPDTNFTIFFLRYCDIKEIKIKESNLNIITPPNIILNPIK